METVTTKGGEGSDASFFYRQMNTSGSSDFLIYIFIYIKIDISLYIRYIHRRTSISLINVDSSDAHSDRKKLSWICKAASLVTSKPL